MKNNESWDLIKIREYGFTIVEVLVSLLVLSVGLIGLASLQVVGMQNSQGGAQRAKTANLAHDITDRKSSKNAAVTINAYNYQGSFEGGQGADGTGVIVINDECTAIEVTFTVSWNDVYSAENSREAAPFT